MPNTDKTILLPQLQRYDEKIKGWVNDRQYKVKVVNLEINFKNGQWEVLYDLSFDELVNLFNGYTRVFAQLKSGTTGICYISNILVELFKQSDGSNTIGSSMFVIQKFVESSDPSNGRMVNAIPYSIFINMNRSTIVSGNWIHQYVDATEFTNTGDEDSAKLSLKDGGVTTAKIADGAITKAKLGNDVVIPEAYTLPEATASTLGGVKVYGVLSSNFSESPVVPLAKSNDNLLVLQTYTSRNSNEIDGYVVTQTDNKQWPGIILKNKTVTADKIADGAITADKLASGVGGGISISTLTDVKIDKQRNHIYIVNPDYPSVSFYLDIGYEKTSDISNFIYGQIDAGDYIGLCVIGIGYTGKDVRGYSSGSITLCQTSTMSAATPTNIGLSGPGITNTESSLYRNTSSNVYLRELNITPKYNFVPKSTSAQAALATLLPVQDECEQMEAEVAKLEQDWIDHPDETVAVDGNGVPITIATKKAELEKKQAELEKLRQDYFSKLGDWKNESQE